jgi:hypothetical protein
MLQRLYRGRPKGTRPNVSVAVFSTGIIPNRRLPPDGSLSAGVPDAPPPFLSSSFLGVFSNR